MADETADQFLGAVPCQRLGQGDPIVADGIELDQTGTAGAVQVFAQSGVRLLGLVVAVRADESIENLPHREWQVFRIFDSTAYLGEQPDRGALRLPRREPTDAGCAALIAARPSETHAAEPNR